MYHDFSLYRDTDFDIILQNIGMQLKLDLDGKDYILKHTNEDIQLTINDSSEGEVN